MKANCGREIINWIMNKIKKVKSAKNFKINLKLFVEEEEVVFMNLMN